MKHLKTHTSPSKTINSKNVFVNKNIPEITILKLTSAGFTVDIWDGNFSLPKETTIDLLKNYDAFLSTGGIQITSEFIQANEKLQIISQASAGYNNIDLDTAKAKNIKVANAPGTMSKATADMAFLLMLSVSRKMIFMNQKIKDGQWENFDFTANLGQELYGKTLGVFGLGRIGFEMARLCKSAYGMQIIYHNRSKNEQAEKELAATYVSFEKLVAQSDVLSVHSALTAETKGVFNKSVFEKMKSNSIFVNVGRGGIHNEEDLIAALQNKTIWGAGLDVTNPEPMDKENPLLQMENVAVTPHIGSATVEARTAMADMAAQNIIDFFKGKEVVNQVN
ncbi:Lactate dehydrogenase [Pustulibacterium marinum]|uniref:Lactate dehydrogenase n=1 Tax=Pustulibacterium marinum TaxID=1224947 RepID=A0A1I7FB64_9FLAO|nr:D-glycerate dehydrogenase [Pustulibacterium marinum]SFU33448.1 Lactate dehydrogenase [Pustulibacterium marinum]